MDKDKFKVYTNNNVKKKNVEEITFELEVPHEDTVTGLFVTSPYFAECMMSQPYFYYPVDVEAEESLMAPILNPEVLHDFLGQTQMFRLREEVPAAALLHIVGEDEEGNEDMFSIFDGMLQIEFTKFFHTVIAVMNQDVAMEEVFEEVFADLLEELEGNGYLDKVLNNIADYLSDPEVLEAILFPEEEE